MVGTLGQDQHLVPLPERARDLIRDALDTVSVIGNVSEDILDPGIDR